MAGFYNSLIFWNGCILFTVYEVFVGRLVCSVILLYIELYKLHWNVYIIFIVGVVFASTLVSSVNALYGTKLHWNVYILLTVGVVFAGKLVSSVNMELSSTGMCIFSLLYMWSLLVDWFVL